MVYDLIIVGSGSAGLTAAIYAARKKMNTLILTKQVGGQSLMTNNIENYPGFLKISGIELIRKIEEQVKKYGVEMKDGFTVSVIEKTDGNFLLKTDQGEIFETKTIIIASGRSLKKLDIPGAKEFENKGIAYCAICDAPLFEGKDVAVIGGGNAAFVSAMDLISYADKIYILQHRDKFVGDEATMEKLRKNGKVQFIANAETKEIRGKNFVESLIYEDLKTGEKKELSVGGVFINIGNVPATDFIKDFLKLNKKGEIIVDHKNNETSMPGIFAAGDVIDLPYKQCIIAAGEGAKAALSAHQYILELN